MYFIGSLSIGCLTYRLFAFLLCLNFSFNSLDFCISIVLFTRLKIDNIQSFEFDQITKKPDTVAAMSEGFSDSVAFFLLFDMIGSGWLVVAGGEGNRLSNAASSNIPLPR